MSRDDALCNPGLKKVARRLYSLAPSLRLYVKGYVVCCGVVLCGGGPIVLSSVKIYEKLICGYFTSALLVEKLNRERNSDFLLCKR